MPKTNPVALRSAAPAARGGYAKSRDTRARILAAALEEAGRSGFHKASVARIAARAGVAVGNLNYHFGSRGDLLRELMASLMGDLLPRLHAADVDAEEGADFFARERAGLLTYLDYLRSHPAHVRLANEIRLHEPQLYRRALAAWVERIAARIRTGIERGTLAPMDDERVALVAHFLLGASQSLENLAEGASRRGYPGDEAVVDAYVALLRKGLAREPRRGTGRTHVKKRTSAARASRTRTASRSTFSATAKRGRKR